jgi:hypothetical protein
MVPSSGNRDPRRTINGNVNRLTCSDGHTLHNSADARGVGVPVGPAGPVASGPSRVLLVPGDLGTGAPGTPLTLWRVRPRL